MFYIRFSCFAQLPLVSYRSEFVSRFDKSYLIFRQVSASLFYKLTAIHPIHNTARARVTQTTVKKVLTNVIPRESCRGQSWIVRFLRITGSEALIMTIAGGIVTIWETRR